MSLAIGDQWITQCYLPIVLDNDKYTATSAIVHNIHRSKLSGICAIAMGGASGEQCPHAFHLASQLPPTGPQVARCQGYALLLPPMPLALPPHCLHTSKILVPPTAIACCYPFCLSQAGSNAHSCPCNPVPTVKGLTTQTVK